MTVDSDVDVARRSRWQAGGVRFWIVLVLVLAVAAAVAVSARHSDHGNPDPGHHLLDALGPVAAAVPAGVSDVRRDFVQPKWDSCDGIASTYGWDDVTVDVSFNSNGVSDATVFAHIKNALHSDGWTYEAMSTTGAWYWKRDIVPGHRATIQLLGGSTVDPPNTWDLQATTPAAIRPVKGC